jgi:hypothetical protein
VSGPGSALLAPWRWAIRLATFAVVIVALIVGLDYGARYAVQRVVSDAVKSSAHARSASVSIHSFPFLYDLAVHSSVDRIDVVATSVPAGPITLDRLELVASGIKLESGQILQGKGVIKSVSRADITVQTRLTSLEGTLARSVDAQVVPDGPGRLAVTAAGHTVTVIDLTKVALIPPCPLTVTHSGVNYTISCSVSPLPASVIAALDKRAGAPVSP